MPIKYRSSVLSCAVHLYMMSLVICLTFIYMKILEMYFIITFKTSLMFGIGFHLKCAVTKKYMMKT